MKFKITLPEQEIKPEVIEKRIRAMFTEDLERGGILAKVFVFSYLNQPCSVTEITKKISEYYKIDLNRGATFRALQRLTEKYILNTITSGDVLMIEESAKSSMEKAVTLKYYRFLKDIPESFKKNFNNINYYWISNGEGMKYIEWCCKLLNFRCEQEK